ncbi:MAG: phosphoglycerate kinase, partial [Clostridia bacterium]|nr:phosphoglycerate kinase [Clostridia bacterium]
VEAMKDGEIVLLQNTRYRAEETKNGEAFSRELASLCDLFVNDAFGAAHRAHCSTVGVASFVEESANGYLMAKEIQFLGNAVENPVRPFVTILGGAKVADKLNVIENLLNKVDTLIIGGAMAYTFKAAAGEPIGTSLCETDKFDLANDIVKLAKEKGVNFLLPLDSRCGDKYDPDCDMVIANVEDGIPDGYMGLDVGPRTEELFANAVKDAGTVIWNGPMGVSEWDRFASGTISVAKAVAESDSISIIGGGDSVAAVQKLGFADKMTHISTGGGASLEFLEGKELPGIAALNDK